MLYGCLYHRFFPVVTTFAFGDAVALFFIAVYYRYTTERRYALKVLGVVIGALIVMTIYAVLGANGVTHQTRTEVEYIVGSFGILASMFLYGAGLEKIAQVLKFKTAVFIPIHMVVAGTVNQTLWLAYLGLDGNWFMFGSSVMCTTLCVVQLVLYWVYHPNKSKAMAVAPCTGGTGDSSRADWEESARVSVVVVDLSDAKDATQPPHLSRCHAEQGGQEQQTGPDLDPDRATTDFQLVYTPRAASVLDY